MYGLPFGSVNFRSKLNKGAVVTIERELNYGGTGTRNLSQSWISGVQLHDAYSGFSTRHFNPHLYITAKKLFILCGCTTSKLHALVKLSVTRASKQGRPPPEECWYFNRAKVSNIMIEATFTTITRHIPIFSSNPPLSLTAASHRQSHILILYPITVKEYHIAQSLLPHA